MAILGKKVALFINIENLIYKEIIWKICNEFEDDLEVFQCNEKSNSLLHLGMNVKANYDDFDYIVIINPLKKSTTELKSVLLQRQLYYLQNILGSREQLEKSLKLLENSRIEGMLVPYVDYIKAHNMGHYDNWQDYYSDIKEIADKNDIRIVLSRDKSPVISEDGFAIIKTEAIRGIETVRCGDLDAQGIFYLMSIYMQNKGFLPAYIMKEDLLINNQYGYEAFNENKLQCFPPIMQLESEIYYDFGDGFEVSKVKKIKYILKIGKKEELSFKIKVPQNIKYIRFDPCEKFMCVCSGISVNDIHIEVNNLNGIHFGNEDLFLTKDPQYILSGDFSDIKELEIRIENLSIFWSENGLKEDMDRIFEEKEELVKAVQHLTNAYGKLEMSAQKREKDLIYERKQLEEEKTELEIKIANELETNEKLELELTQIKNSRSWKIITKLRKMKNIIIRKKV